MPWESFEASASRYEGWYATARGRRSDRAEQALLASLLDRLPEARVVLEVGAGTGHFTRWLVARGLRAIGLDRSPAMLREARRISDATPLVLADAHRLPFGDGAVDLSLFVTTLEFLEAPRLALDESVRVARHGVVLVALNRWSLGGLSRRIGPQARGSLLARAHDFSLSRLRRQLREAAGDRLELLDWRSALLPRPLDARVGRLPGGDVIGLAARLAPRA